MDEEDAEELIDSDNDSDTTPDDDDDDLEDGHLIQAPLARMITETSAPNGGRILNAISLPMPVTSLAVPAIK